MIMRSIKSVIGGTAADTPPNHTTPHPASNLKKLTLGECSRLSWVHVLNFISIRTVEAVRMKNVSSRRTVVVVSRNSSVVQPE